MTNYSSGKGLTSSQTFTLKSKDLGGQFTLNEYFNGLGHDGKNKSPQLYWENAPEGTFEFAVTIYDIDAPTDSGFWHWLIVNIPGNVNELKSDAGNINEQIAPLGSFQPNTDFGMPGYNGPAPTPGPSHRYLITVFALSEKLQNDSSSTPAFISFAMRDITLAKASLVVYGEHPSRS